MTTTLPTLDETRPVNVALHVNENDPLLPQHQSAGPAREAAEPEQEPSSSLYSSLSSTYFSTPVRAAAAATADEETELGGREEEGLTPSRRASFLQTMQEGAASIVESVQESVSLLEWTEGLQLQIVEQVADVADALLQELHQADDDDTFFLEMGLSRNLSLLPTDMVEVAQTVTPYHQQQQQVNEDLEQSMEVFPGLSRQLSFLSTTSSKHLEEEGVELVQVVSSPSTPAHHPDLSAYMLLATAVVSLSSIGPFLELQHDCTATMKVTWRTCGTACMLLPFCWLEVSQLGGPKMTCAQWTTFALSTMSYVTMTVGFVLALQYTTVGNAVILSNSQAILLLLGKFAVGAQVTQLQGSGALLAFIGAVLCTVDSAEDDMNESNSSSSFTSGATMLGDAFGLMSGVGGVLYLVFAKAVRAHMKLYTFMFLTMSLGCLLCTAAQILILGETVTLDFHYQHGLFGFLTPVLDRLPVELFIVVICNMFGTLGYVRAMQFFDNLIISVATLMEPVVAELIACMMGVSSLPGYVGWLGNALVATGTLAVVYPTPGKTSSSAPH